MTFRVLRACLVAWLLWMEGGLADVAGVRATPLTLGPSSGPGLELLPAAGLGIDFTNGLRFERLSAFQNLMNGTGVAAGDVDGDGLVDLFFAHRDGVSALYRNLGGWRFTNITQSAGVALTNLMAGGAVLADITGDGALDLMVTSFGGPHAFLVGDGKGHFTDGTASAGIASKTGATSMAVGDLDGDGDLDVYWCNFGTTSPLRDGAELSERMVNGVPTVTGRWAKRVRIIDGRYFELGEPDVLYWNLGNGRLRPAVWAESFVDEDGRPLLEAPPDFGLAVQVRDIDGDGNPDIYVCNDFQTPDRMWLGDGKGRFRAAPRHALRSMSYASMGVDFADIDRDGHLDFYTAEMLMRDHERYLRSFPALVPRARMPGLGLDREDVPRNGLFRNRGDNTWEEIACQAGVAATEWSWAPVFLDVDLDGWEDLLVSNGFRHDVHDRDLGGKVEGKRRTAMRGERSILADYPPIDAAKVALRNRRDGTFEDVSEAWGFQSRRPAHGTALADLDGDGDLDVVVACMDGPPLVYRNRGTAPRVAVRLRGRLPNVQAIGARVRLLGGPVKQEQEIVGGGQYLSGSEPLRTFAAGTGPMTLEVRWRDGGVTRVEGIQANHEYRIDEALAARQPEASPKAVGQVAPWFERWSMATPHRHQEEPFDDFGMFPSMPRRFSQQGPGLAVTDVDGDGHEDVLVAGGKGQAVGWLAGDGKGGWKAKTLGEPLSDDGLGLLALRTGGAGGGVQVWTALSGLESGMEKGVALAVMDGAGKALGKVDGTAAGTEGWLPVALAASDADGDGVVDVFAGSGRAGAIWRWQGGSLSRVRAVEPAGPAVPGATAATWADMDGDGFPELVLASEWGTVRLLDGRTGRAKSVQPGSGTGWWRSVATPDLDGDGRLDLVAGNWGLNSEWAIWATNSAALIYGQVPGQGAPVWMEARVGKDGRWHPWRERDTMLAAHPELEGKGLTHASYAATEVRGWMPKDAVAVRAEVLATCAWLNRGDHFIRVDLPPEAQRTPVSGIVVGDFDGDGKEDLFLAQNWFAVRPDDTRMDAGLGLMLRGDGRGGWSAVGAVESGIRLVGEQRGAATGDFDEDGRPDLVVAQNGEETVLLRNQKAAAGIRVRLAGPPGNPWGLGATVRLRTGARWGPARAVTGGGGYASQDSPVLVLASPGVPTGIEVRWPGGKVTQAELGEQAREVTVAADGVMQR
ncbi:MAG: FG-GAP-like repeat-containing protein [Verrucomicrobiota bacterium]|jgi:hypothetical protein